MAKNVVDWIALVLAIVGSINWGLTAFDFNVVELVFGSFPALVNIVYYLVGLAGLYLIYYVTKE
ncbi:DUF378 domain-containing protein [Candidatus Woesearchaeota archaeon]|nr:DUF378 domain-containing protein [Candidatus Woesearchaeota archaeon]